MKIRDYIFTTLKIIFCFLIFSKSVYANGNCVGPGGTTNVLTATLGNHTITDGNNNKAGYVISPAFSWVLPGYVQSCSCNNEDQTREWYFTSTTNLPPAGDGWLVYDDYLDVQLLVSDSVYWPEPKMVPFTNQFTNHSNNYECNKEYNMNENTTGSHGALNLRIRKPFIGTVNLPSTVIAYLYGCSATDNRCDPTGAPTVAYVMSGSVTVPQTCVLNSGSIVTVDFGSVFAGKFNTAGEKPNGFTPVTKQIAVSCNGGVESMANLTLRFEATPDANYSSAIATDNTNVGVVVTDMSGNIIKPDTGLIPFKLNDSQATVSFQTYPVSTTGNPPSVGKFTALAYIRVDFA